MSISFSNTSNLLYTVANADVVPVEYPLFRNKIINGNMIIDQRNGGNPFNIITNGIIYGPDRLYSIINTGGTPNYTIRQKPLLNSDIYATGGKITSCQLFVNSNVTFADNSKDVSLRHSIEGLYIKDFLWGTASAKNATVSLWVKSNVTGNHSISFQNADSTRSYVTSFSIPSANIWVKITVALPGPTTGTWNTTSGIGVTIIIDSTCENKKTATLNSWQTGDFICISTYNTNIWKTRNNYLEITGLTFEKGSATPDESRPFSLELSLCRRYYETSFPLNISPSNNTSNMAPGSSMFLQGQYGTGYIYFKTQKCVTPGITFYNPWNSNGNAYVYEKMYTSSNLSSQSPNTNGFSITSTDTSLQNSNVIFNWVASSELIETIKFSIVSWVEEVGGGGSTASVTYFYAYLGNFASIQAYCVPGARFFISSPLLSTTTTITSVSNPRPGNNQQALVNFTPAITMQPYTTTTFVFVL